MALKEDFSARDAHRVEERPAASAFPVQAMHMPAAAKNRKVQFRDKDSPDDSDSGV